MVIGLLVEGNSAPLVFDCASLPSARSAAAEAGLTTTEVGTGRQSAAEGGAQAYAGEGPLEARLEQGLSPQQVGVHVEQEDGADEVQVDVEALHSVTLHQGEWLKGVVF